jgi:tRNA threonylcarbamoyladenosine biosynthesis protein TsaE
MNIPPTFRSTSPEQTQDFGRLFASEIIKHRTTTEDQQATVICLYGELGSGKTTFTQGLAQGMGYHRRLLSPTFLIMRTYDLENQQTLYHLDLYRIQKTLELDLLGLAEVFADPKSIVVIEWAEKMSHMLPKTRWEIQFMGQSDDERTLDTYQRI